MSGYRHFKTTGNQLIDDILSEITNAGNAFHDTSYWPDESEWLDGKSYIDKIQEAADKAAKEFTQQVDTEREYGRPNYF